MVFDKLQQRESLASAGSLDGVNLVELKRRMKDPNDSIHADMRKIVESAVRSVAFAGGKLGDKSLEDDFTQQVSIKVWQGIDGFDGRAKLSTWIYRIARNVFLDYLRDKKRHGGETETLDKAINLESDLSPTEKAIVESIDNQILFNSLRNILTPEEFHILEMRFKRGLMLSEMAEELNMNLNTLKSQLFRLVEKIKASVV